MIEERRKFLRSECLFPAELVKLAGKRSIVERATVRDFSREGLKLIINLANLNPSSGVELKLYVPEIKLSTSFSGKICWSRLVDYKLEVGLKTKQIDEEARDEILNWIFLK